MREDDLPRVLRSGTSEFAALADVPDPAAIRRRGDRRRRRNAIVSGLLAFVLGAGGGGLAYANIDKPAHSTASAGTSSGVQPSGSGGTAEPAPAAVSPGIIGVTTAGVVEVLDPETLDATKQLTGDQDAVGDQISVSPDQKTVYFAAKQGCDSYVMAVPADGSATARQVAKGVLPAVSPDGKKLAFVTEASSGGPPPHVSYECSPGSQAAVVVMDLASGGTSTRPIGSMPISHLSWSADGTSLLISGGPAGGNKGWQLDTILLDGTNGIGIVPVTGANAPASYYREGVYLPGGDIVVNRVCCSGTPAKRQSSLILRIDPAGNEVHQIAQAFLDKDHTSLAVDPTGHWIMYLAGNDLFISHDGATPKNVAPGLVAATWL